MLTLTFILIFALLTISWEKNQFFIANFLQGSLYSFTNIKRYLLLLSGMAIIAILVFATASHLLNTFNKQSIRNNLELMLGIFILILSLAMTRLMIYLLGTSVASSSLSLHIRQMLFYTPLFPAIMAAIIYGIMLNITASAIFVLILSLCLGILYHGDLTIFLLCSISLLVTVMSSFRARRRTHLMRAGLIAGLTQSLFIIGRGLIAGQPIPSLSILATNGIANGFLGGFFCAGLLPIMEYLFHVTTDIRLVELSDLNHPLLKKLVLEAPGTYHHSLIVANLSEAAAEAINANPLLTRVGAYFHDVGKLKKPEYFSENEWRGKSRHDDLIPSMSSLIIMSHVKDGIDLASKYGLPKEIIDIIQQHHGRSIVFFFYKRAEENLPENGRIDEEEYRYPGPIPQTKEAAIILLADAVEAASRSLDKPTPSRIANLIEQIFNARITDGQLDQSLLTMNDLSIIKERFAYILNGIFHTRPKYPTDTKAQFEEEAAHGNQNQQSPEKISNTSEKP